MTKAALGGSDWTYDAGSGAGQQGILDGAGANNIGLLVRVWGEVTQRDLVGNSYFYLDDGSNVRDTTVTGAAANVVAQARARSASGAVGVRMVASPSSYPAGSLVVVTGVSSCFKDGSGRIRRQVIPISIMPR